MQHMGSSPTERDGVLFFDMAFTQNAAVCDPEPEVEPDAPEVQEWQPPDPPINAPGQWGFMVSHTQRDGEAKVMAGEIYFGLKELGYRCWLDVKMNKCDIAAMEEGVRRSKVFLAIVTDNGNKDESYFSRWMCREEIKWAMEAGRTIVPVVRMRDKDNIGKFIAEAASHGLDFGSLNFVHLDRSGPKYIQASLETIVDQVALQPGNAAPASATLAAAASPARRAFARDIYLHLVMQPPPLVIGEAKARAELHARIESIGTRLSTERADWIGKNQYPLVLSDGSSLVCELEAQLREGRLHGFVWCGKGYGWEHRTRAEAATFMPTIDRIADIIRQTTEARPPPELAVVCLECGARKAADELVSAGVQTVLWLELDTIGDGAKVFCDVIGPVLQSMHTGAGRDDVCKQLNAALHDLGGTGGCTGAAQVSQWTPLDGPKSSGSAKSCQSWQSTTTWTWRHPHSGRFTCCHAISIVSADCAADCAARPRSA
jgi:hypothetical protein